MSLRSGNLLIEHFFPHTFHFYHCKEENGSIIIISIYVYDFGEVQNMLIMTAN